GTACGLALDQEQLTAVGIAFRTIREFARKSSAVQRALATREVAGLARSFTRACGFDRLVDDLPSHGLVLLEESAQALVDECLHHAGDVRIQLALGLAFELWLWQLYADDGNQAFAHIVTGQILLHVLEQSQLLAGVVDGACERGPEPGEM